MESTDTEPMRLHWQYCRAGWDITTDFYAEEVRAWQNDFCFAAIVRVGTDPDQWRIEHTDGRMPDDADQLTFASPTDAVNYLATHHGLTYEFTTHDL